MIGKTISHYKILEKLGEGGMGVVYKAEDTILHRPVALKFLPPDLIRDSETQERFLREARAAAALDHPSICTVHEIGDFEGKTFIAMAHIDGQGLDERLKSGPMDVNEAIDLSIQVAEGLQDAHENGIIHRDIKAANIMITKRGHARIMDFGLAKLSGQTRLTKTATIMGTVAYMSPEQAHGKSAIDHHTDIWSLGVVLYEMLTGQQPFTAPTDAGLIYKIVHEEPEPIEAVRTGVPEALSQAVKKMMQKEPEERYEDMEALISDLKAIRAGAAPEIVVQEKHIPSIAVLPFADMSPQKDQEYFCDGISESIINELTQLSDLRVIARTSAFSFKGQNLDVREIGKKLNVGTVLEGSIQKAGDRVRVTAQLVNTARGEHLWSEKFDRDMQDIFAIQDEISGAIVDKLKPTLIEKQETKISKRQSVDLEAYNIYLRGRWFADKRTAGSLEKAIEHFEKAIEEQPNYAYAYAGLADCYSLLSMFGPFPPKEVFPKAREAALRALEIDNTLAEAHTSLGMCKDYYDWDWEGAERDYKRAIALNPGYSTAHHQYAMHLGRTGRFAEAITEIERALELDPLSLIINNQVGMVYHFAGEYREAEASYKKTLEMDPDFLGARFYLGLIYARKHMYEEALELMDRGQRVVGEWETAGLMVAGYAYALTGRRDEAEKVLRGLLERSKREYVPPVYLAIFHFLIGEVDKGFALLDKAYEERDTWMCFMKVTPALHFLDLRSDPRYHGLLRKMGLEE